MSNKAAIVLGPGLEIEWREFRRSPWKESTVKDVFWWPEADRWMVEIDTGDQTRTSVPVENVRPRKSSK